VGFTALVNPILQHALHSDVPTHPLIVSWRPGWTCSSGKLRHQIRLLEDVPQIETSSQYGLNLNERVVAHRLPPSPVELLHPVVCKLKTLVKDKVRVVLVVIEMVNRIDPELRRLNQVWGKHNVKA
jgi:hypothetical protein